MSDGYSLSARIGRYRPIGGASVNAAAVRRIQGGRAMDAEDRHGSSGIVTEAAALARIMENAELVTALARAERERIATLIENFPIRNGSALITRAAMARAIRELTP